MNIEDIKKEMYNALYEEEHDRIFEEIYDEETEERYFEELENGMDNILEELGLYLNKADFYKTDNNKCLIYNRENPGFVEIPDSLLNTIARLWDEPKPEYLPDAPGLIRRCLTYISPEERESFELVENNPSEATETDKENHNKVMIKLGRAIEPDMEYIRAYLPYEL